MINPQYYLILGTHDDNVHYQQSMLLSAALEEKDILFRSPFCFHSFLNGSRRNANFKILCLLLCFLLQKFFTLSWHHVFPSPKQLCPGNRVTQTRTIPLVITDATFIIHSGTTVRYLYSITKSSFQQLLCKRLLQDGKLIQDLYPWLLFKMPGSPHTYYGTVNA